MALRLMMVDDHRLFRDGLRALLASLTDFEIVGEAADARAALRLVEKLQPDVVLLDVGLPGSSGLSIIHDIERLTPETAVLMLTMHTSHEYVLQAFAAGASGYALKDQPADQVAQAVRTVAAGDRYLAPALPASLMSRPFSGNGNGGALESLSAREREIFDLAVRGFSNQGIAGQLFISVKTVETHRAHINRKLGVHSVAELFRFAARHGLLQ